MNVELTRFKVKPGKSHRVDEWMQLLNDNLKEVLLTLNDEKMYVETIFREIRDGEEYLYWYSVQGKGGTHVKNSHHEIDKKHLAFWYECIDEEAPSIDMKTEVVMIQDVVKEAMK
ncbi:DUF6176 family protein [Bacillus cereus]|uniref:DUF6176 family protein n=1 Tax=Bacillus thuringiensis TaxID=1428 RepID=A0AAW9J6L2_BACTU|nr:MULTISPECIES: DUF6176 family protein [Bacillus cereus group]MCU4933535.1 DUF6176 family protein [Bacillus cereus]MCU5183466.1 DUF6176 family protein [Bacillus cereus]MDZ5475444.1 DUF6176 family protein [Bacillus thuringiensis]MRB33471.1 hypothetical protein [Bacillus thuringiensis]TKH69402.1 hypothetical protein FC688_30350 [Bacillus cereus]